MGALSGYAAGAQFRLRAPTPGCSAQAAECLQGSCQNGLGVVDAPLPPQPLPIVQLQLGPLERPAFSGQARQRLGEVTLGVGGLGEQPAGAGGKLCQPRPGHLIQSAQRAVDERPRLEMTIRTDRGGGEIGDAEVGDLVVHRGAVVVEELAELYIGGQVATFGQRRDARRVPGPGRD